MKRIAAIFFIILPLLNFLFAQSEKPDSLTNYNIKINPLEKIEQKINEFELFVNLNSITNNFSLNENPNTKWLWTSLIISNSKFYQNNFETLPTDIFSFQHQKYLEDSKFNPLKEALGMAQAAVFGYALYMHVKKYGFFKE